MGHGTSSWMDQVFPSQHKMQRTGPGPGLDDEVHSNYLGRREKADNEAAASAADRKHFGNAGLPIPAERLRPLHTASSYVPRTNEEIARDSATAIKKRNEDEDEGKMTLMYCFGCVGCCYSSIGLALAYWLDVPIERWNCATVACNVLWPCKLCSYCCQCRKA
jgi:hypothetical protein